MTKLGIRICRKDRKEFQEDLKASSKKKEEEKKRRRIATTDRRGFFDLVGHRGKRDEHLEGIDVNFVGPKVRLK